MIRPTRETDLYARFSPLAVVLDTTILFMHGSSLEECVCSKLIQQILKDEKFLSTCEGIRSLFKFRLIVIVNDMIKRAECCKSDLTFTSCVLIV
jgi:hypothetical protein